MGALRLAILALALVGCGNPWLPSACDDGVDNDGDGRVDLADPDCPDRDSDAERHAVGMDAQVPTDAQLPTDAGDAGPDAAIDATVDATVDADAGMDPDAGGDCALSSPAAWTCPSQRRPTRCGAACVDIEHDPAHCGGCDRACAAGDSCRYGTCWPCAAASAEVCADGLCVGPARTPRACGGCGGPMCGVRQACAAGVCEMAGMRRGDQCNRPLSISLGEQAVRLFATASLDAAWPRCGPVDRPPRRGAILSVRVPSDGDYRLDVAAAGIQLGLQALEDVACRCADPRPEACAADVGAAALQGRLRADRDALFLVATDDMAVSAVDVTLTAL